MKHNEKKEDNKKLKDLIDCASENKEKVRNGLDLALKQNKIIKKLVNKKLNNESLKKGINIMLDHQKVTKDAVELVLDNKEEVKKLVDVTKTESALDLIDYALDNEDFTKKQ